MSNATTTRKPVFFDKQIPVSDFDALYFKEAIQDKKVRCIINGARIHNPFNKSISVDISFKVLDDLEVMNPGTSITGKTLSFDRLHSEVVERTNVKGKNVTINFNVRKDYEKGVFEVNNTHELYSIVSKVFKDKELMKTDEDGSIIVHYSNFEKYIRGGVVYLTSKEVLTIRRYATLEVYAVGETQ